MSQKFCSECGFPVDDDSRFCENCGKPVVQDQPASQPYSPPIASHSTPLIPLVKIDTDVGDKKPVTIKIIAGICIVLVIIIVGIFILPSLSGSSFLAGSPTTTSMAKTTTPVTLFDTPVTPTPTPEPYPNALQLKEYFPFGDGEVQSKATVYRYWINNTYEWHNDMDNRFYVQKPRTGYKYLIVFVNMENNGETRVWFPRSTAIAVHYDGGTYYLDQTHKLPDKTGNIKDTAVEIKEIQYIRKLSGAEYVEDFGYSHSTQYGFLYPGQSNAVDGYIIYEVPESLTLENTYVVIPFNAQDTAIWKLV